MVVVLNTCQLLHKELRGHLKKEQDWYDERNQVPREYWTEVARPSDRKITLQGDNIINCLNKVLESGFGITRSETQWKVHKAMIESLLPVIFGREWQQHQGSILKRYELKALAQEVMIIMARRDGKSYSVAMALAAFLILIPNIHIAVFATGKRMASALMDQVKRFVRILFSRDISEERYTVKHQNEELLHIIGPDGSDRVVRVMPGTAKVCQYTICYYIYVHACVCVCVCL